MIRARAAGWRPALREVLHPPIWSIRFWLVQLLAIAIGLVHAAAAQLGLLRPAGIPSSATLVLFLVPALLAAFTFGLSGAIATAAWVTVLAVPAFVISNIPDVRWASAAQLLAIVVVTLLVGRRIDVEWAARRQVEAAREAHRRAEARYRALFGSSVAPILVTGDAGVVVEANPAAERLFGAALAGRRLADLLPVASAPGEPIRIQDATGEWRALRAVEAAVPSAADGLRQVILQDVTGEERERRRLAEYAAGIVHALEEERQRVSAALHDDPLQSLLVLGRRLERVAEAPALPAGLVPAVADTSRLATAISERLRTIAADLRPPLLDDLGLEPALRQLVAGAEASAGLAGRLEVVGLERRPAPALEVSCFRLVQEAVRGVEHHAGASRLRVRLARRGDRLHLLVADDGIDPAAGDDPDGTPDGLAQMRGRTRDLGGRLRVRVGGVGGTVVAVSLPIDAAATAAVGVGPQGP